MSLLSLITRAQAFHEGTVGALESNNPFATFTLIRGYAETTAALLWIAERPRDIEVFYPGAPRDRSLSVGKLVNRAQQRMGGLKGIYDQLSGLAHPTTSTALSGWHGGDEGEGAVRWGSVPEFKNDDDFKMGCFWLVELAEATGHGWREAWDAVLGPGSPPPPEMAPRDCLTAPSRPTSADLDDGSGA